MFPLVNIQISSGKKENGKVAAEKAANVLRKILSYKSKARFIAATGVSQIEFLKYLCESGGIEWDRTEMFHLDEYIGLTDTHPASFRRYLTRNLIERVNPGVVHLIKGEAPDPVLECERISALIKGPIDIAFIGIGENGHIAFNDPPADFETDQPYIIVNLDEKCRMQQVGEGWFNSIEEVPNQAISMSVKQILKAEVIICTCPDKRKAEAVRDCLSKNAPVTPLHPASILKKHENVYIFLDTESASLLNK